VYAAGTVASIAACFNPVLCAVGNGLMAGVAMADRTYEFVNSGAYNDGVLWSGQIDAELRSSSASGSADSRELAYGYDANTPE
jgi:hypothetical protein